MTLYTNKELYGGPCSNGAIILERGGPTNFGRTEVVAWPVTDGPTPNANIVGHLRGTFVQVDNTTNRAWHFSLGLVFENTRFNGSTLQVSGTSGINGEWSIVGETGQFNMAKGTIKRTSIMDQGTSRISELRIHAHYTPV
ncbi:hypothetical protein HU200_016465 [Digitaria exilis]|uniref:Dirigent protein n=1 Tax=Digitaria exilis TaxID=1010633 RepID=A0A835F947_9POAL|nr:hypothetical protein HU200_016465 [Digitaria exilis]